MGMNQTPASERIHIGFFGKRNAGKSSVVNKDGPDTGHCISGERNDN